MKIMISILILFTSFESLLAASKSCDNFYKSEALNRQIQNLKQVYDLPPVWDNYNVAQETIVLTDVTKYSKCAVIFSNGELVQNIELENIIDIKNGVYEFFPFSSSNDELTKLLNVMKVKYALVISIHNWFPFPDYISTLTGADEIVINTISHEGFHLFQQFRSIIDPDAWKSQLKSHPHERPKSHPPVLTKFKAFYPIISILSNVFLRTHFQVGPVLRI